MSNRTKTSLIDAIVSPIRQSGRSRLCVLSLNPAIDAEWSVDEILWEEKNLVHAQRRWAGGKGANVVRWLRFLGARPELLIPLGGIAGRELAAYLHADKLRARIVNLAEETRVNVVITNRAGRQMRFNQPGARLSRAEWRSILAEVQSAGRSVHAFVLSGSLPPGAPVTGYAGITRLAHQAGRRVYLDCDGATLKAAVRAKPFLVKPNRHELAGWAGSDLPTLSAARDAALALAGVTGGWVLVSLGAEGALLIGARTLSSAAPFVAHAHIKVASVSNTLGAGDATLAAAAHASMLGLPPREWLRAAVAAGTAATQAPAGRMVSKRAYRDILQRVVIDTQLADSAN